MSEARCCRRRTRTRRAAVLLLALAVAALSPAADGAAQEATWTARVHAGALSVEDRGDWTELRQELARRLPDGRRLALGSRQTRRFGTWDASLEAAATLRPGDAYLSLDARYTPGAEILEDALLGARLALPVGEVVPSVGYRLQLFPDGPVHTMSPRVEWYRGPWLVFGELRVIDSAVETVNFAGIARVTRRISSDWSAWIGLARGEEDFLVGRPPTRQLRTLRTQSLFGGVEHAVSPAWTVRVDLTGVDSDPTLDRIGASLTITRTF